MRYTIVSARDEKTIIKQVNDMIEQGWETEGGVFVANDGTFYQTLILFDDDMDEFDDGEEL